MVLENVLARRLESLTSSVVLLLSNCCMHSIDSNCRIVSDTRHSQPKAFQNRCGCYHSRCDGKRSPDRCSGEALSLYAFATSWAVSTRALASPSLSIALLSQTRHGPQYLFRFAKSLLRIQPSHGGRVARLRCRAARACAIGRCGSISNLTNLLGTPE